MRRFTIIACLAAFIGACAPTPYSADSSKTIGREFTTLNFTTRSGDTDLLVVGFAHNVGGKVQICAAAGAEGNPGFEPRWPGALLAATSFYLNGELVGRRADFGSHYPGKTVLSGKTANCGTTDTPWKSAYDRKKVRLKIGSIRLVD